MKWKVRRTVDLSEDAPSVERLKALATLSSRIAHELRIRIQEGKSDADLNGLSAKLSVILPDRSSLLDEFDGQIEGSTAVMPLPNICYSQAGEVRGVLYLADASDGGLLPIYAFVLLNSEDLTDIFVDTANVVPSISELLAQMQAMREVTKAAQDAAGAANSAAENAVEKAQAAQSASEAANAGAQAAQTAAGVANTAAGKIDNMTVAATALDTGQPPTAALSEVDGHYLLSLGLPRGATGATPQINVQVTTGAPGSQASVSVTGTAENPVIHLTIPRGDTGELSGLIINGQTPDESGNVTLAMEDIEGLTEAIESAGSVKKVAGVGPDSAGNVPLTAANVGAYPAGSIRMLSISLAASAWTGSGPYTATIADTSVTAHTDCRFDLGGTQTSLTADIVWETADGQITLTTSAKPTGRSAAR